MSNWKKYDVESKIIEILRNAECKDHHFGTHLFLTPYQIAVQFLKKHPNEFHQLGTEVGGKGTGKSAVAHYLSNQLSIHIKSNDIKEIEASFISMNEHSFKFGNKSPASRKKLPIYRIKCS